MAEKEIPLTNGDTVIVNDDRRSLQFNIDDLYKYRLVDDSSAIVEGTGKFVPREKDSIIAYELGMFRVGHVDMTTYVADLHLWELPKKGNDVGVEDVLLGIGPGYTSETWRAYLDTRQFPHLLDVDVRLHMYSDEAKYIRIFKGVNISASGEVISGYYTQSGDYVNEKIPLALVATTVLNNLSIKAPVMGYTTRELDDGAVVTIVAYNDADAQVSICKVLIHNTNVVRRPEEGMKRVKSIELISPYLSTSQPNILEVPINATVATLALRAKVTYTSGQSLILDVVDEDANGKFKLLGLKYWSPTIAGQNQEVDLVYQLNDLEEYSYLQGQTANGRVRVEYGIRAMAIDPAYSLKLYVFPTWLSDMLGYGLEYWLYDLNRKVARRVPKAAIQLQDGGGVFDGFEFTTTQLLKLGVTLSVVDPAYGGHVHVQTVQVALLKGGGQRATNWKMKFSGNQPAWFGDGQEALVRNAGGGMSFVNIACGQITQTDWLNKLYKTISPLYDTQNEPEAPLPTHVVLTTQTRSIEIAVSQWNTDVSIINDLAEGQTLYLKWIKRGANGDLQLGVSGLPVHNV